MLSPGSIGDTFCSSRKNQRREFVAMIAHPGRRGPQRHGPLLVEAFVACSIEDGSEDARSA
eukprot:15478413-Alexandrium_andersonii.AAC.1